MPDYSLGRAHGKIEIDYDGSGAGRAAKDLDTVALSSAAADKSLEKTQKTLRDTGKEMRSAGDSASGYQARLRDVEDASRGVEAAEQNHRRALLDSRSTLEDIKAAEDEVTEARKRHTRATNAARDAERAMSEGANVSRAALSALTAVLPRLGSLLGGASDGMGDFAGASGGAAQQAGGLADKLGGVTKLLALAGPQGRAAAVGVEAAAGAMDMLTGAASRMADSVKMIASLEATVGKVSGLALGAGSLGGLAGLGGAAGVQGMVDLAGAAKQLSGVLGLLPGIISGVEFSMGTLDVAFRGVGDALKDMMADDPKKFLEDIKDMGPLAAQAMLSVAQFRDDFKASGRSVQESFFAKVAGDIVPLIQTWLPQVRQAMSEVAGVFGEAAHQLAGLLQQPQTQAAFLTFVNNVSNGLKAMEPAMKPLLDIFSQLTVVGSSFFEQIGGDLTGALSTFANLITQAASSGSLQRWIQDGINAFERLGNIIFNVGYAFGNIMDVAEQFGGGGLLGWLEQLSGELAKWTASAEGQKALTDFFTAVRQATDAFIPLLGPLVNGLSSIGVAFVKLGVAAAPGFLAFVNGFASAMQQLGPQLVGIAPAITQFMTDLGDAMIRVVQTVGPQLPTIFAAMANAFSALLPQLPLLIQIFTQLVEQVGPQLPKLFEAVTDALIALVPLMPTIIGFIRDLVSIWTKLVEIGTGVIKTVTQVADGIAKFGNKIIDFVEDIPNKLDGVGSAIGTFVFGLADKAIQWGKNILINLIKGIGDSSGISSLLSTLGSIGQHVVDFFKTSSPARRGPLHDISPNEMGARIVNNLARGMVSAQGAVESAARSTAGATVSALGAVGGAPAAGGADGLGGALLPPNIAGADDSILDAYLRHQFPDNNGLKGFAKDMGNLLQVAQSGFNLLSQNLAGTLFGALGMVPGLNNRRWTKMSPEQFAAQQEQEVQRKATSESAKKGPSWADVLGPTAASGTTGTALPLGLSASSSKADIQKAIIAAGRGRGLGDAAIQTALAVAAAESGFDPTISGGVQGSAGLVSGLFQQSPSSGWGTLAQVNDPNHAINAFYDAYAKQLTKNPTNPLLAAVLTQNPQLGSGAQGSDYWNAVSAQLGLGGQILQSQGKGVKGPSWQQLTGAAAPSGTYGLRKGTDTGGYGTGTADVFPAWVMELAKQFGVSPSTYAGHQESDRSSEAGYAPNPDHLNRGIDWSGSVDAMQKFAEWLQKNAPNLPGLEQIIWQNPNTGQKIGLGGRGNPTTGYYPDVGEGSYAEHQNHVHTRQSAPLLIDPSALGGSALAGATTGGGLLLAGGKTVDELLDTSQKNLTVNDQLLQSYLQGNPALAAQIDAAKTPGASDDSVLTALTGIDTTITGLKAQDAVANENTINALQSTQNQIAQGAGFQQAPSALQTAQSVASGVGGAVTGAFQVAQSFLDSLAATQDMTDRLVYGLRNAEDVMKIVDDLQNYITFAANIANEAGSILSAVGSLVGAGAGADPTGGASGAAAGIQAAGQISQLIAGALQAVNMAINFGQQIYHIAGTYVGRFLSQLTAGIGGTPLMGDVRFLLNKNTGQLLTYSEDNPGNQNALNVPSFLKGLYGYGGGNPNPQVNTQWNIYAGPGQSPGEMLNETMWMVNTAGTTGAMSPANF